VNLGVDDTCQLFRLTVNNNLNVIVLPQEVSVHDSLFQERKFVTIIEDFVHKTASFHISCGVA
jgi:hypothetical protein